MIRAYRRGVKEGEEGENEKYLIFEELESELKMNFVEELRDNWLAVLFLPLSPKLKEHIVLVFQ